VDTNEIALHKPLIACQECGALWLDPAERWRLYLDTDEPPNAVPYCPVCAAREFDPD
jgi:hypothetical protein